MIHVDTTSERLSTHFYYVRLVSPAANSPSEHDQGEYLVKQAERSTFIGLPAGMVDRANRGICGATVCAKARTRTKCGTVINETVFVHPQNFFTDCTQKTNFLKIQQMKKMLRDFCSSVLSFF